MTGTIKERITDTRARLDTQRERVRTELNTRTQDLLARGRRLRRDLDKRRDVAMGRLRDGGLEKLFGAGEHALLTAASLVERAEHAVPRRIALLEGGAARLRKRAEQIEEARGDLQRPGIERYDELNVADVTLALSSQSPYQLQKLRQYEASHKNRVTVLREIDRLLGETAD